MYYNIILYYIILYYIIIIQSLGKHRSGPLAEVTLVSVPFGLDSAKGGAVETGCSGLHYIVGCFII